jgi:hypothetical protein
MTDFRDYDGFSQASCCFDGLRGAVSGRIFGLLFGLILFCGFWADWHIGCIRYTDLQTFLCGLDLHRAIVAGRIWDLERRDVSLKKGTHHVRVNGKGLGD